MCGFLLPSPHTSSNSHARLVGIETGYGLDDRGVGVRILTSPYAPDRHWVHPSSYTVGTGDSFPGVKRQGREVQTFAEVKKT
jgi:hypothetical protein